MFAFLSSLKRTPLLQKNSTFAARVVDNNDPLKLQRVKIRIQKLHRGVVDADLPWASPVSLMTQGNNQVGAIKIPVNGSQILVEYLDDYTILYKGDFVTSSSAIPELTNTNYPNCYGYTDRSGNKFLVDTQTDTVTFTHLSGATLSITATGDIIVKAKASLQLEGQSLSIKTTNDINISCGAFNVNAASIANKASGANVIEGATITMNSNGAVTMNAASFALNAAFNLTPVMGWATPPAPAATAPSPVFTPPTTPTARTKPTITPFTDQTSF